MTKEAKKAEGIGGRGKKRGLERTVVALTPEQVDAVREEAMRRMVDRRVGRMDAGEVVREAVDRWTLTKAAVRVLDAFVASCLEQAEKLAKAARARGATDDDLALVERALEVGERIARMQEETLGATPELTEKIKDARAAFRTMMNQAPKAPRKVKT